MLSVIIIVRETALGNTTLTTICPTQAICSVDGFFPPILVQVGCRGGSGGVKAVYSKSCNS